MVGLPLLGLAKCQNLEKPQSSPFSIEKRRQPVKYYYTAVLGKVPVVAALRSDAPFAIIA